MYQRPKSGPLCMSWISVPYHSRIEVLVLGCACLLLLVGDVATVEWAPIETSVIHNRMVLGGSSEHNLLLSHLPKDSGASPPRRALGN